VLAAVGRSETSWPTDILPFLEAGFFEPPPFNELLGPTEPRGRPNGLLLRGGRLVARWGDTRRVDMTFSVAKSYLSLIAGLAVMDGLIRDLDEPVSRTVRDGGSTATTTGRSPGDISSSRRRSGRERFLASPIRSTAIASFPSKPRRDAREMPGRCASPGRSGNTTMSASTG
jgi:hypothetical protein